MIVRNIVEIDEELCNGCGECIPNCAEGALKIVDGKARLVKDIYCDGMGACLGHCPQDAISIIQREAEGFDEEAVHEYLAEQKEHQTEEETLACGCPGSAVQTLEASSPEISMKGSALRQWPVQLNLVPVEAPFYEGADLLVMADCVPVAYPNLHSSLLPGRIVLIGCPTFDNAQGYAEKLSLILKRNDVRSVTVAHMEVPCCSALNRIVDWAVTASGKDIPIRRHVITVKGELQ